MPNSIGGPRTSPNHISLNDLQGKEIAQGSNKVAETASSRIELSTEIQPGLYIPDMKISTRSVDDPNAKAKIIDVPTNELSGINKAEDFGALLTELQEKHQGFMLPEKSELWDALGEKTEFSYNNITGRRIDQFYKEASGMLDKTGLNGSELTAARKKLNLAHADAFRGRTIKFDDSDTGTYWSYQKDAAFVHVYEKMLDSLPKDSPQRKSLQNQIDFVFTKKYTPTGSVDENNIERSLKLVAIDSKNRQAISMNPRTIDFPQPTHQTITVDGSVAEHGGKAVVWDHGADVYKFAETQEVIPAELNDKLVKTPVDKVVFRRAKEGESLRDDMRFDWNSSQMIDQKDLDTSWWGHCDTKATMESVHIDMKNAGTVSEFRSDSGVTTDYDRDDLLEIMASQLNMGGGYVDANSGEKSFIGENEFGGARFDKRDDKMYLNINGKYQDFGVRIKSMSEVGEPSKTADIGESFENFKVKDDHTIEANDGLKQTLEGDTNVISADDRKLKGEVELYTVNDGGHWVKETKDFTIDPSNADQGKVLIGSQITSIGDHTLQRFYFDPKTKEVSSADVSFKKDDQGNFKATEGEPKPFGKAQGEMFLAREMTAGDDLKGKNDLVTSSIRTGVGLATDSSTREEVWNGAVNNIREEVEWRSEDGKFERIGVHLDAVFGSNKVGTIINELDDEGKVVNSHESKAAVDFYWRNVPRVAPLVVENGSLKLNSTMMDRGLIDVKDIHTSLDSMRNMNDLLYLGLSNKDKSPVFTIVHEGKRLVYDNKDAWQADVDKLKAAGQ